METHIALDNNNPINWSEDLQLCEDCQDEIQKNENGFEFCSQCDICIICVEYNNECICNNNNDGNN